MEYNYDDEYGISCLRDSIYGWNPKSSSYDFQICADTTEITDSTWNVDLGLVSKQLDLATYTYLDSTTLKINDKTTKYDYSKTLKENLNNLGIDIDSNLVTAKDENKMIQYLELSDYNYRIEDYYTPRIKHREARW